MNLTLFIYVLAVVCPIRYWPLEANIDQTWRFALNYAHAEGLTPGTEIIFTCGPLGYLVFPQHIGSNLGQALVFQSALWVLLGLTFADLFFRAGVPFKSLVLFSVCLGMSARLFWFEFFGLENLMLAAALILLVVYWAAGGLARYFVALLLIGLLPFIKLTAAAIGSTALFGFLMALVWKRSPTSWRDALLALLLPASVAALTAWLTIGSTPALLAYVRGSWEITSGFSSGMASVGPPLQFAEALLAVIVLASLLRNNARFYALLLIIPVFVSFKHGFARQDALHVEGLFAFLALCLGLILLQTDLQSQRAHRTFVLTAIFSVLWGVNVQAPVRTAAESTGLRALWMLARAFPLSQLEHRLDASEFPAESSLEPELIRAIGDSPVASLSIQFSNLQAAGLRLRLYPVVQRYSAYTPYLDGVNAAWIRDRGPRFLVFDGDRIDGRDTWAETPAMWLEVYRWYGTRLLGTKNLLLERRAVPRFSGLKAGPKISSDSLASFHLPPAPGPLFWKLICPQSRWEQARTLLLRAPIIFMTVHSVDGTTRKARVIPQLLATPVIASHLPGNLAQYERLFQAAAPGLEVADQISFSDSQGAAVFGNCPLELLTETPTRP